MKSEYAFECERCGGTVMASVSYSTLAGLSGFRGVVTRSAFETPGAIAKHAKVGTGICKDCGASYNGDNVRLLRRKAQTQ